MMEFVGIKCAWISLSGARDQMFRYELNYNCIYRSLIGALFFLLQILSLNLFADISPLPRPCACAQGQTLRNGVCTSATQIAVAATSVTSYRDFFNSKNVDDKKFVLDGQAITSDLKKQILATEGMIVCFDDSGNVVPNTTGTGVLVRKENGEVKVLTGFHIFYDPNNRNQDRIPSRGHCRFWTKEMLSNDPSSQGIVLNTKAMVMGRQANFEQYDGGDLAEVPFASSQTVYPGAPQNTQSLLKKIGESNILPMASKDLHQGQSFLVVSPITVMRNFEGTGRTLTQDEFYKVAGTPFGQIATIDSEGLIPVQNTSARDFYSYGVRADSGQSGSPAFVWEVDGHGQKKIVLAGLLINAGAVSGKEYFRFVETNRDTYQQALIYKP